MKEVIPNTHAVVLTVSDFMKMIAHTTGSKTTGVVKNASMEANSTRMRGRYRSTGPIGSGI